MNIADFLSQDAVLADITATTKTELLAELAAPLAFLRPELASVDLLSLLQQREALGSTAVGEGIALPHGKVPALSRPALACGRSLAGIAFDAPDHKPCHLFFLILVPENGAGQHLRLLAQIAHRAKEPLFRQEVMLAKHAGQLWQVIVAP